MQPPKKLQALWNKKLKASGFEDAERPDGSLKKFHSKLFYDRIPEEMGERQRYFSLAAELGKGYEDEWGNWIDVFADRESDRKIWMAHCDGYNEQDIATKLGVHRNTVSRVITKYNKFIIR